MTWPHPRWSLIITISYHSATDNRERTHTIAKRIHLQFLYWCIIFLKWCKTIMRAKGAVKSTEARSIFGDARMITAGEWRWDRQMKVYHHPKVSTVWGLLDRDYCFIRGWENSFPPYNITASCFMNHNPQQIICLVIDLLLLNLRQLDTQG